MSESRLLIFEIYRDGTHERTERLEQDVVKIGSHAKSHLFLDDANVSRVHAVVEVTGDDVFVIDLGSGKGTTVGGQRVNKQKLSHGDRIGVGGYELVIRFHEVGERSGAAGAGGGSQALVVETDDEIYTRRFLRRAENSDGSVEAAMLFRDLVIVDDLYQPPTTLKVGSGADCQFQIESALIPGGEIVLLEVSSGEPVLLLREGMEGEIWVGDSHFTPADAISSGRATPSGDVWRLALTRETRARIVMGELVFFFRRSEVPKFVFPIKREWRAAGLALAVSTLIQGGLILVSLLMPPEVGELAMEREAQLNRYVQMLLVKPEEKKPEEKPEWLKEKQEADKKSDKGAEKADKSKPEDTKTKDKPEEVTELARAEARDEAMNRGAVDVLNQLGPSNVFGGDAAAGVAELEAIGGVSDTGLGQSYGQGGLGKFGGGLASGGGRLSTGVGGGPIGVGRSGGNNVGGNLRGVSDRKVRTPVVSTQPFTLTGALDMDIVRRVIAEHRREIIACYETELQKVPELQGRIDVEFVIGPDGAVGGTKLKASTLKNDAVHACVQRRVKQWRFPEPKGGGTVRVSYPWIFTSGG